MQLSLKKYIFSFYLTGFGWICIWMYVLLIYASYPVVLLGQNALLNLKSFTFPGYITKQKHQFYSFYVMWYEFF